MSHSGNPSEQAIPPIAVAPDGAAFVKRCCALYLCALIGFWVIGLASIYFNAHRRNTPFSARAIFFLNSGDRFRNFLNFDPVTERFSKAAG